MKKFIWPTLKITEFENVDIITTSNDPDGMKMSQTSKDYSTGFGKLKLGKTKGFGAGPGNILQ